MLIDQKKLFEFPNETKQQANILLLKLTYISFNKELFFDVTPTKY